MEAPVRCTINADTLTRRRYLVKYNHNAIFGISAIRKLFQAKAVLICDLSASLLSCLELACGIAAIYGACAGRRRGAAGSAGGRREPRR